MAQRTLTAAFAAWAALAAVCAQTPSAAPTGDPYPRYDAGVQVPLAPERFHFNILCVTPVKGLFYKVYPADPKLPPFYKAINVPARMRSDTYAYNGPDPLEFYWMPEDKDGKPEMSFRYNPPPSGGKRMLVLRPGEQKSPGGKPVFELFDLDLSEKNFPAGSYVVLNLSDYPLAGVIDGERLRSVPRVLGPRQGRASLQMDVYAYAQAQNRIFNVTRSKLPILPQNRYWICFFPATRTDRPMVTMATLLEPMFGDEPTGSRPPPRPLSELTPSER